jgi:hypothetical protein
MVFSVGVPQYPTNRGKMTKYRNETELEDMVDENSVWE